MEYLKVIGSERGSGGGGVVGGGGGGGGWVERKWVCLGVRVGGWEVGGGGLCRLWWLGGGEAGRGRG